MAQLEMVGARCPQEWREQIKAIAATSGRNEAAVIREAIALYLSETDPRAVKGAIANLEQRVARLEEKLSRFGRLAD